MVKNAVFFSINFVREYKWFENFSIFAALKKYN